MCPSACIPRAGMYTPDADGVHSGSVTRTLITLNESATSKKRGGESRTTGHRRATAAGWGRPRSCLLSRTPVSATAVRRRLWNNPSSVDWVRRVLHVPACLRDNVMQ